MHEASPPPNGSWRHEKAQGHHPAAQEPEEAASSEQSPPWPGRCSCSGSSLTAQVRGRDSAFLGDMTEQGLRGSLSLITMPLSFLLVLGVDSQTVVTQEPSLSVSPGGTVTLTCGLSSGSVSTSTYPKWFQQTPGKAPRTLIYSTSHRPSGVPEHFSGSISGNKATLTITGAQPEDEGDYYCCLYYSGPYNCTVLQSHGEVRLKPPCPCLQGTSPLLGLKPSLIQG